MSGHTPGPWRWKDAGECDSYRGLLINKRIVAANSVSPGIVFGGLGAESEANARLIAAAPELLEACKAFVEGDESRFMPGYHDALAAIAKAEGR